MGDLLLHSTVVWLNAPGALVKSKKDPDLVAFGKDEWVLVWVRTVGLVLALAFFKP